MKNRNPVLLAAAAILILLPLVLDVITGGEAEFSGADGQARDMIETQNPDYRPWFEPLWQPPSAEVEGLLFALQAALGAGLLGYYLGYRKGRQRTREEIGRTHVGD
jgi:cobalt/nickel transport protein